MHVHVPINFILYTWLSFYSLENAVLWVRVVGAKRGCTAWVRSVATNKFGALAKAKFLFYLYPSKEGQKKKRGCYQLIVDAVCTNE